jgi:outer membrane protein assembly factor BamD (BamD/ComL family)
MLKRSPLILLLLLLGFGHPAATSAESTPNPARFASLQARAGEYEASGDFKAAAKIHARSQVFAPDDRARAKALLGEADDYYSAGIFRNSKDAYLNLLRSYPLYTPQSHVLQRLREMAELYVDGTIGTFSLKDVPMAIEIYETIIQEAPTASGTINDHLRLAELQIASGRQAEALVTYEELFRRHAGRSELGTARLAFAEALTNRAATGGDGDGQLARQARRQIAAFLEEQPNHPRRAEAEQTLAGLNEQQATSLYNLAVFYTNPVHRRLPATRRYLHDVIRNYPNTVAAGQAKQLLADLFEDDGSGTGLSDAEAEARADLVSSPQLTAKVVEMLNTIPDPPEPMGTPKQFAPLTGDDPNKYLLPLGDVNVLE